MAGYRSIEELKGNEERLNLLFSEFRNKSLNPLHYYEKMRFFQQVIEEYSEKEEKLSFSIKDIEQKLVELCERKPSCLREVFHNLARDGIIVKYEDFVASLSQPTSWVGWSAHKVLQFGVKLFNLHHFYSANVKMEAQSGGKFVYIPEVSGRMERIYQFTTLTGHILNMEDFKKKIKMEINLKDDKDIDLIILYLKKEGRLATDSVRGKTIVKLFNTSNSPSIPISQKEKAQFEIKVTTKELEEEVANLIEKRQTSHELAKLALVNEDRFSAKKHLKTRMAVEKRVVKVGNVLNTLNEINNRIDDAETDAKIFAVLSRGNEALGDILKDNNLTVEKVTDVLSNLQDIMEQQEEISEAMAGPIHEEDSEAELELEKLIKEEAAYKRLRLEADEGDWEGMEGEEYDQAATEAEVMVQLEQLGIAGVDENLDRSYSLCHPPNLSDASRLGPIKLRNKKELN